MHAIEFYKMSGCGNDFIVIDNRAAVVDEAQLKKFIVNVCRRKMSVGADGLILVEDSQTADFSWRFFNSDGSRGEMCGNGARCVARFAQLTGIAGPRLTFETEAGPIQAAVNNGRVRIRMTEPSPLGAEFQLDIGTTLLSVQTVNTGVPHALIEVADVDSVTVVEQGRAIRHHPAFAPAGTNVNFVCPRADGTLAVRTYERGVEDETLACGTGAVASALLMAAKYGRRGPIRVLTRSGGHLEVHFEARDGGFENVHLEGDARVICVGRMEVSAWEY